MSDDPCLPQNLKKEKERKPAMGDIIQSVESEVTHDLQSQSTLLKSLLSASVGRNLVG